MRSIYPATLMGTILLGACGQGTDPENATDSGLQAVPDTLILSVTDTIGIEMGDSCYVFGQLMKACHGTDGSVIALDMQQARLSVYSPDGDALTNLTGIVSLSPLSKMSRIVAT